MYSAMRPTLDWLQLPLAKQPLLFPTTLSAPIIAMLLQDLPSLTREP